jgi:hypothetical protein
VGQASSSSCACSFGRNRKGSQVLKNQRLCHKSSYASTLIWSHMALCKTRNSIIVESSLACWRYRKLRASHKCEKMPDCADRG